MTLLDKALELYKGVLEAKPKTDAMVLQLQQYIVSHWNHEGTVGMRAVEEGPLEYRYKSQPSNARPLRAFQHPLNVNKGGEYVAREEADDDTPGGDELAIARTQYEAQYKKIGEEIAALGAGDPKVGPLVTEAARIRVRLNALSVNLPTAQTNPSTAGKPKEKTDGKVGEKNSVLAGKANAAKLEAAAKSGKQTAPSNSPTPPNKGVADSSDNTGDAGAEMPEMDVTVITGYRAKALGEAYAPEVLKHWLTQLNVTMTGKESRTQLGQLLLQHVKKPSA